MASRASGEEQVYERQAGDACVALPPGYRRREPEKTILYQVVQAHLATFLTELREADERGLPQYVELEFTRYLACGILSEGFTRVRCEGCGNDLLVAFSCKSRGICPSCTARRARAGCASRPSCVAARSRTSVGVLFSQAYPLAPGER